MENSTAKRSFPSVSMDAGMFPVNVRWLVGEFFDFSMSAAWCCWQLLSNLSSEANFLFCYRSGNDFRLWMLLLGWDFVVVNNSR